MATLLLAPAVMYMRAAVAIAEEAMIVLTASVSDMNLEDDTKCGVKLVLCRRWTY